MTAPVPSRQILSHARILRAEPELLRSGRQLGSGRVVETNRQWTLAQGLEGGARDCRQGVVRIASPGIAKPRKRDVIVLGRYCSANIVPWIHSDDGLSVTHCG